MFFDLVKAVAIYLYLATHDWVTIYHNTCARVKTTVRIYIGSHHIECFILNLHGPNCPNMFFHNCYHVTIEKCYTDISYHKHGKAPVRYVWLNIRICVCVDKLWLRYQFRACLRGLFTHINHGCFIFNRVLKGIGTTSKQITAYFYEYAVWLFQRPVLLTKLVKCPNPSGDMVLKWAPVRRKRAVRVDGRPMSLLQQLN